MVLTEKSTRLQVVTRLIALGVRVIVSRPLNSATFQSKLEYVAGQVGHAPNRPVVEPKAMT